MKVFCKAKKHWDVVEGKLFLGAQDSKTLEKELSRLMARLEAEVRLDIYEQICALGLIRDRKKLVKMGIENVALLVQDACAQIAIGEKK
jgi:hypothetical protein